MATNNFKAFATANGANVTAQSDYEALTALLTGFQSGKASSAQINKAIRQSSTIAAVVAQYIANSSGNDVLDNGDTAGILANLILAIQSSVKGTAMPLLTGVTGEARNVRMSITAASATATITADEVIVSTALGGNQYRLANVNKTINIGTAGLGGMNTGAAPSNGWVAIYLIYNPTTGDSGLVGINTTSSVAPNCFGVISQLPGYTASALISVWRTNSSSLLQVGYQRGRKIQILPTDALYLNSNPGGYTAVDLSAIVPKNAVSCTGYIFCNAGTGAGSAYINLASDASGAGFARAFANSQSGGGSSNIYYEMMVSTPQVIYYQFSWNTSGASTGTIGVSGYII